MMRDRGVVLSVLIVTTLLAACSGGPASSEANDALLDELRALPGAIEVGRTSDGATTTVTYRLEDAPGAAVLEFYLASLPAEWELTEPLGDAPEAVAFCRGDALLRIDASRVDAQRTFTMEAQATGAEECG